MAPKTPKGSSKKQKELESDPAYLAKRERNNLVRNDEILCWFLQNMYKLWWNRFDFNKFSLQAVQKSRQKAKEKAQKTKQRVNKLKEDNKILEGKIEVN